MIFVAQLVIVYACAFNYFTTTWTPGLHGKRLSRHHIRVVNGHANKQFPLNRSISRICFSLLLLIQVGKLLDQKSVFLRLPPLIYVNTVHIHYSICWFILAFSDLVKWVQVGYKAFHHYTTGFRVRVPLLTHKK